MLYHTSRISLNWPFLIRSHNPSNSDSHQCLDICISSIETITNILKRCKPQHLLKTSPLTFVHGAIMAAEVSAHLLHSNLVLDSSATIEEATSVLDAALEDLSYSWEIARTARNGLQSLRKRHDTVQSSPTSLWQNSASDWSTPESSSGSLAEFDCTYPVSGFVDSGMTGCDMPNGMPNLFVDGTQITSDLLGWDDAQLGPNLVNSNLPKLYI